MEPVSAPGPTKGILNICILIVNTQGNVTHATLFVILLFWRCEKKLYVEFSVSHPVNVIKGVFTASTVTPVRQKGKIRVQENKTPESLRQKSRLMRVPQEKEPGLEVVKLKKVPVKPPEPEKQVVTHKAEVTRHYDPDFPVHGLHNRDDQDVTTLGRTERVITAEEQTVVLGYCQVAERVVLKQEMEKESRTKPPKPQKEGEPERRHLDKKKIIQLSREEEQKASAKVKLLDKSEKPEELQKIRPKQFLTKPREPEKEAIIHEGDVTRHYETEVTAQSLQHREDGEVTMAGRSKRVLSPQEASELSHSKETEKLHPEDVKSRWTKPPKTEEPESDLTLKKIKILPKKEEEQEGVILKPFEKPQKAGTAEPKIKTETELTTSETELHEKPRVISMPNEEKTDKAPEEDKKKSVDTNVAAQISPHQTPIKLKEPQPGEDETSKTKQREEAAVPPKKPRPSGKKEAGKNLPQKNTDALKRGMELEKTASPRVVKEQVKEEKSFRPVEQQKKVPLKRTSTPKDDTHKLKELENIPISKKPSAEKVRPTPKTMSPRDPTDGVKKVPETASDPGRPSKVRLPLLKEVSPRAVQMKKVPTQPEEEVFQQETEEIDGDEEEEVWGWELVPLEDWGGEGMDGVVETPSTPGSKGGEVKAS